MGQCLFVELKSERGKVTAAQDAWLSALQFAGLNVFLWRPDNYVDIRARLLNWQDYAPRFQEHS
jgi:hypothetical protein